MGKIAKLLVTGEDGGSFTLACRLSNTFRDAGYGNRHHTAEDGPAGFDILFDTAPDITKVRAVVKTLPPEQQRQITAFGYALATI